MDPRPTPSRGQALGGDDGVRELSIKAEIAIPLSRSTPALMIVLAALAAVLALTIVAPDYFTARGFPLDDAWIHAVYGRELARTGTLAYNPGIAATGSTSPLWSVVLALVHLAVDTPQRAVLVTKWVGFAFHVLTALVLYAAFAGRPEHASMRLIGALLVALHPDLISASVSGMEIPLATVMAAALVWATARASFALFVTLAAAAFLARPELALIGIVVPLLAAVTDRRAARLTIAGGLGTAIAGAGLAARNMLVSGLPLPATFYAKVGHGADPLTALRMGFGTLLPQLAMVQVAVCVGLFALLALRGRLRAGSVSPLAAAAFIAGLVFCAASVLLVTPHDPGAFYHQRYVLPALPLLLAATLVLADSALSIWSPIARRTAAGAFVVLLGLGAAFHAPERYRHLANDAHNIDDVQVAVGRWLASAAPGDVVWAIDAGAVRYFGNAFVVDLMGLNSPALLTPSANAFLAAHPPRYLEVVPSWSALNPKDQDERALPAIAFQPSTPYTVTGISAMRTHRLIRCDPQASGEIRVRSRRYPFTCAP